MGNHVYLMYILIIEALIIVPACYAGGTLYGLVGVAAGISIPRAILRGFVLPIIISKKVESNLFYSFIKSQVIVLIGCLPFIIYIYTNDNIFGDVDTWLEFVLELFVGMLIYIVSIYLICLNQKEKSITKDFINRYRSKLF